MYFDHQQNDSSLSGMWGKFIHRLSHGFSMALDYIFQQRMLWWSWKISAFGNKFQKKGNVDNEAQDGSKPSGTQPVQHHVFGYKSMEVDISVSECPAPEGYRRMIEVMKNHTYNK